MMAIYVERIGGRGLPGCRGGIKAGKAKPLEVERGSRLPSVKWTQGRDFAGKMGSRCNRKKQGKAQLQVIWRGVSKGVKGSEV